MPTRRLALISLAVVLLLAVAPARAAGKKTAANEKGGAYYGLGAGALLPQGTFADFNDPSYFIQTRSLYVDKVFGGRAAAYYGDTAGVDGGAGGHVYGFDFDLLLKFGSASTFGYVFAGAGYGKLAHTVAGPTPGSTVRLSGYDWCWTGGLGFTFKRKRGFYLEASYVSYQTDPTADFIPVVLGFQY